MVGRPVPDIDCDPCVEPGPLSFDVLADPNERSAAWYPGSWIVSQGGNGGSITARPAENVFHIAASNWNIDVSDPVNGSKGIAGWNQGARACNGYIDQYGNMQQYCSVWSSVNGTKDGNWRCRTWESWNPEGLTGSTFDTSTWTGEQCERFSDILAWDSIENGAILADMADSRRSSHGNGVHRYGITGYNPWQQVGGEVWSGSSSKVCPGSARVRQLPGIIARARVIADAVRGGRCGYLPPGRVNLRDALARTNDQPKEWDEMATRDEIRDAVREVVRDEVARVAAQVWGFPTKSTVNDQPQTPLGLLQWADKHGANVEAGLSNLPQKVWDHNVRSKVDLSMVLPVSEILLYTDLHSSDAADLAGQTLGAVTGKPPVEKPPVEPPNPVTYTVVAGDTLSKIASRFGVTVADLVAWNGLADPDSISVGQVLKVSAPKA